MFIVVAVCMQPGKTDWDRYQIIMGHIVNSTVLYVFAGLFIDAAVAVDVKKYIAVDFKFALKEDSSNVCIRYYLLLSQYLPYRSVLQQYLDHAKIDSLGHSANTPIFSNGYHQLIPVYNDVVIDGAFDNTREPLLPIDQNNLSPDLNYFIAFEGAVLEVIFLTEEYVDLMFSFPSLYGMNLVSEFYFLKTIGIWKMNLLKMIAVVNSIVLRFFICWQWQTKAWLRTVRMLHHAAKYLDEHLHLLNTFKVLGFPILVACVTHVITGVVSFFLVVLFWGTVFYVIEALFRKFTNAICNEHSILKQRMQSAVVKTTYRIMVYVLYQVTFTFAYILYKGILWGDVLSYDYELRSYCYITASFDSFLNAVLFFGWV